MSLRFCATLVLVWFAGLLICPDGRAEEPRYFQKDGVTFRQSGAGVQSAVPASPPTVRASSPSPATGTTRDVVRNYWTPVTQYAWEGEWVGRWNPFVEPYLVYRPVALTHWELKREVVKVPVSPGCVAAPPAAVVVRPATPKYQGVSPQVGNQAVVVSRPAVAVPARPNSVPAVAQASPWGGIRRLDSDPPRQGTTGWHGASTLR